MLVAILPASRSDEDGGSVVAVLGGTLGDCGSVLRALGALGHWGIVGLR